MYIYIYSYTYIIIYMYTHSCTQCMYAAYVFVHIIYTYMIVYVNVFFSCVCVCVLGQPFCCGWSQTHVSVLSQIKMQTWRVKWVERNRKTHTVTVFRTIVSSR